MFSCKNAPYQSADFIEYTLTVDSNPQFKYPRTNLKQWNFPNGPFCLGGRAAEKHEAGFAMYFTDFLV